jgi:hypothetical protein
MTPQSIHTTTSTEDELQKIIARNNTSLGGGESKDPTEESIPTAMSLSNASSFSVSKAYANYPISPQRQRFSTPPPQRVSSPNHLQSPTKSFDSSGRRSSRKIALNDPSSFYSMPIGKVQVQNAPPLSPNHRSSTPQRRQQLSPVYGSSYGSFRKVDTHGNVGGTGQKSEAYERASKLLQPRDASKAAAEKVEKAREAARLAMEKAKKAKAAKLQQQQQGIINNKTLRFADEVQQQDVTKQDPPESIGIPRNIKSKPEAIEEYDYSLYFDEVHFHEDDDLSTVQDRYGVDERNRYDVENAEEDAIDDVLDLEAKKAQGKISSLLPPLFPPSGGREPDDLNDMMDFAEAMLGRGTVARKQQANEIVADACVFTDELGCGDDDDAMSTIKPMSPTKRYPMGTTPAVLERVLEDEGIPPPPSPPPEVMDSVAFRVQQNAKNMDKYDQTDSELEDIMTFAAGLLGSKSGEVTPSSPVKAKDVKKKMGRKSKSPTKKKRQEPSASIPEDLGEGDELDQIMDFAAGLLGSKQPEAPPPPPPKKAKTPRPITPSSTPRPITPSSIVESVQANQNVPNTQLSSYPKPTDDTAWFSDACSVWHDELFQNPEDGNKGTKKITNDSPFERPTLLQAATDKPAPVPPPPEAFSLKPVPTLADDLTDKSSLSIELPDVTAKPSEEEQVPRYSDIIQVETVEEDSDEGLNPLQQRNEEDGVLDIGLNPLQQGDEEDGVLEIGNDAIIASHVRSSSGTILDSNDEYWDTLSTIASNSKDFSLNRISHPEQHAQHAVPEGAPGALVTLHEGAPFGAILCGWLGVEQRNGGLRRLNATKAGEIFGETNGSTFISTEGSKVPQIPKMIQYEAMPSDQDKRDYQMRTETLNRVETLITKGSSGSSSSSEAFYLPNRINSFEAEGGEQNIDNAVKRGQTMASPMSPTVSRYGHDKGDNPMLSPTHPSHDSKSSKITSSSSPGSRKVTDNRKPWDKGPSKGSPSNRFQPLDDDEELNRQLEAEDSELAAMLGIKKVTSRKDDAKNDLPLDCLGGSHSQDSEFSDLLMVLTRSAGDDEEEALMSPSTVGIANLSSPKKSSDGESALSPESGEIGIILSSLKRAEKMGHEDESVEMVSSPRSQSRKDVEARRKRSSEKKKSKEAESALVQKDASSPIVRMLFDEEDLQANEVQQTAKANEKQQQDAAVPMSQEQRHQKIIGMLFDEEDLPANEVQQTARANEKRQQDAVPMSQEQRHQKIIGMLFDEEDLQAYEVQQTAKANEKQQQDAAVPMSQEQRRQKIVGMLFDEEDLPANEVQQTATANEKRQQGAVPMSQEQPHQKIIGMLFDEEDLPANEVQQTAKANEKRQQDAAVPISREQQHQKNVGMLFDEEDLPANEVQLTAKANEKRQQDSAVPMSQEQRHQKMVRMSFDEEDLPANEVQQTAKANEKRQQDAAVLMSREQQHQKIVGMLFDEDDLPANNVQQAGKTNEKRRQDAAVPISPKREQRQYQASAMPKSPKREQKHQSAAGPASPRREREQQFPSIPTLPQKEKPQPIPAAPESPEKEAITSPRRSPSKRASKHTGNSITGPELTWAERNAAANEEAAAAASQRSRQDGVFPSPSMLSVIFDDLVPNPTGGVEQLEKAQRQREKEELKRKEPAAKQELKREKEELKRQKVVAKQEQEKESKVVPIRTSCPPMFSVLMNDGPSSHPKPVNKGRPLEYLSPNQSDDEDEMDNIQVVLAPTDIAVRLSPVKNLQLSQQDAQQADEISSVSSREYKTKIMSELLSRYDNIIDQLIHDKPRNNDAKIGNSAEMEAVLCELREQREYAMKLKSREGERQDSRESSSPPRSRSPRRTSLSRAKSRQDQEYPSSTVEESSSPSKSPVRSPLQREPRPTSLSPTKSRQDQEYPSSTVERSSSPSKSPVRPPLQREPTTTSLSPTKSRRDQEYSSSTIERSSSPTKSPVRSHLQTESRSRLHSSRVAVSPTHSPILSSQDESLRHSSSFRSSKRVSPIRASRSDTRVEESLSGSRIHQELALSVSRESTSPVRSSYHRSRSPTRSPQRQRYPFQSRDVATPSRSTSDRYDRTAAPRSPRRSKSSGRAPRPEDKIEEMRRRRAESLSPKKNRKSAFSSQRESESRETRDTIRAVKRVYSPERARHKIIHDDSEDIYASGSRSRSEDESEYGAISREIQNELIRAKRSSDNIRDVNDELFEELEIFQEKLLRHSKRKDCEREFISESKNAMNDFQQRLERVRKQAYQTRRSGRETPDTLEQVEHALDDAWGDFDTVRETMLTNLKMLHEAKEQLMRRRLLREEDTDDDQLLMLENMIQSIRQSQQLKTERAIGGMQDSNRNSHNRPNRTERSVQPEYIRKEQPTHISSRPTPTQYASGDWSAPKERPTYTATTAGTSPSTQSSPRQRTSPVYSSPEQRPSYTTTAGTSPSTQSSSRQRQLSVYSSPEQRASYTTTAATRTSPSTQSSPRQRQSVYSFPEQRPSYTTTAGTSPITQSSPRQRQSAYSFPEQRASYTTAATRTTPSTQSSPRQRPSPSVYSFPEQRPAYTTTAATRTSPSTQSSPRQRQSVYSFPEQRPSYTTTAGTSPSTQSSPRQRQSAYSFPEQRASYTTAATRTSPSTQSSPRQRPSPSVYSFPEQRPSYTTTTTARTTTTHPTIPSSPVYTYASRPREQTPTYEYASPDVWSNPATSIITTAPSSSTDSSSRYEVAEYTYVSPNARTSKKRFPIGQSSPITAAAGRRSPAATRSNTRYTYSSYR